MLTPDYSTDRRIQIEKAHQAGVQAGAAFCGIKSYEAPELNYTNRVVYASKDGETESEKKIQQWTKMALATGANPFKAKATLGLKDPIKQSIELRFHNEGTQIVDEFDQIVKGEVGQETTKVIETCLPSGLEKSFPKNNLSAMVLTGAKGGLVN